MYEISQQQKHLIDNIEGAFDLHPDSKGGMDTYREFKSRHAKNYAMGNNDEASLKNAIRAYLSKHEIYSGENYVDAVFNEIIGLANSGTYDEQIRIEKKVDEIVNVVGDVIVDTAKGIAYVAVETLEFLVEHKEIVNAAAWVAAGVVAIVFYVPSGGTSGLAFAMAGGGSLIAEGAAFMGTIAVPVYTAVEAGVRIAVLWAATSMSKSSGTGSSGGESETSQSNNNETTVQRGTARGVEKNGLPNSVYEQVDAQGNLVKRFFYDENGNVFCRQDFGKPHFIKELGEYVSPHEHTYYFNSEGMPTEELIIPLPQGY